MLRPYLFGHQHNVPISCGSIEPLHTVLFTALLLCATTLSDLTVAAVLHTMDQSEKPFALLPQPFPTINPQWGKRPFPQRWKDGFPLWQPETLAPSRISPEVNKWLVTVAVMLATVMEVLDTTIANVSLAHIRGSLSAGVDEATWVLTSYIVANAIVLALTGWLSAYFGRKRFFNFCVLSFTAMSFLCGLAPNLETLVFFRILQGAAGGAMMPLSQTILMETFPASQQAMAMAMWGLGMMLGPIVGPILGGWITDSYSWRWIFFVNIPVGVLASFLVTVVLHDPPHLTQAVKKIDWWGLGLLVLGVGTLQIMVDIGERRDWFDSTLIQTLAVVSGVSLIMLVIQELRTDEPVLDLRLLKNRSFAVGTILMTLIMPTMYGTFLFIPLYCQLVMGYTPLLAGQALAVQSVGILLSMILVGRLFNHVEFRALIVTGFMITGYGVWSMTHFYPQMDFWQVAWPGFLRGLGTGLLFVPLNTVCLGSVPKAQVGNASALFNMVRALGGGIGIAVMMSFMSQGTQIHQTTLVAHIHQYNATLWNMWSMAGSVMGPDGGGVQGEAFLALVYGEVQRQALALALADNFRLMAVNLFALIPLIFLLRRPKTPGGNVAAH